MKSKTLWIINFFAGTPESGWGERHYYFAKHWKAMGWDVKIISSSFNHMFKSSSLPEVNETFTLENYGGIDFIWVKTPKYDPQSILRFWAQLVFTWKTRKLPTFLKESKPDTIIVSSMPIFPIWTGIKLKKKFKSRLLFEIRDIWPLTLQLLGNKSERNPAVKFIGWFEKTGYREADVMVSLLPNAQNHMNQVAGKTVNFVYIPNGIDPDQLETEKIDEEFENAIPQDKFIIGYAGTIGLANALEYLVKAAQKLKDDNRFHFVIVGEGYLKEQLQQDASSLTNITFLPKIRKNQVQHLLNFFDICFVGRNNSPLFQHGVSANKYFDYMLAAKPILDSNNLIKDPVELSGCGIIVQPDSEDTIIEGIKTLYAMSPNERAQMGQLGKDFVLSHHSIANLAKEYSLHF